VGCGWDRAWPQGWIGFGLFELQAGCGMSPAAPGQQKLQQKTECLQETQFLAVIMLHLADGSAKGAWHKG
jgi:hypothetical protein